MHTTEQLNTALAGRYTIERQIGEGGMATVYLAFDGVAAREGGGYMLEWRNGTGGEW